MLEVTEKINCFLDQRNLTDVIPKERPHGTKLAASKNSSQYFYECVCSRCGGDGNCI